MRRLISLLSIPYHLIICLVNAILCVFIPIGYLFYGLSFILLNICFHPWAIAIILFLTVNILIFIFSFNFSIQEVIIAAKLGMFGKTFLFMEGTIIIASILLGYIIGICLFHIGEVCKTIYVQSFTRKDVAIKHFDDFLDAIEILFHGY